MLWQKKIGYVCFSLSYAKEYTWKQIFSVLSYVHRHFSADTTMYGHYIFIWFAHENVKKYSQK